MRGEEADGAPGSPYYVQYTIPHNTISYHTLSYHTIPYHTIPYLTISYHTIPYLGHNAMYTIHTKPIHIYACILYYLLP